jgi:hypothetical protein
MNRIQSFDQFIAEAKLNTLTLNDSQAKEIWDQLKKLKIGEGDSKNYKEDLIRWESFKNTKGANIAKIRVFSKYTNENLLLISFDIFPTNSYEREEFYKKHGDKSISMFIGYDDKTGKVEDANFKELSKMSNTEMSKYIQSWFNK